MSSTFKRAISFLTVAALSAALVVVPSASAFAADPESPADEATTPAAVTATTPSAVTEEPAATDADVTSEPEAPAEQPVEAEPAPKPIIPISAPIDSALPSASTFTDVTGHWAAADIDFVVRNGLFSGVGDGKFDPNGVLTRGMLVTVLGRYDGIQPATGTSTSFSDVAADAYYAPYVAWASFNGIALGVGGTVFAPDAVVTREQAAKIIAAYITYSSKIPRSTRIYKPPFNDAADVSDWAAAEVTLLRSYGLLDGQPDGNFYPKSPLTRAEASALIRRFVENSPRSVHQTF